MRNILFTLLVTVIFSGLNAQSFSALFYNVENLFYPEEDSLTNDNQFTPDGDRHWNWYRYHRKITSICKLILATGGWRGCDIVALCEIENREVLNNIVDHPLLLHANYGIVHRESMDHRGMDVAILFRKEKMRFLEDSYYSALDADGNPMLSREILLAKFSYGVDTLLLAMNHWTSKYGGALETEDHRCAQANLLGMLIDSLKRTKPEYNILAGGDFNDESDSKSIKSFKHVSGMQELIAENFEGTYKYQGRWMRIDHVFFGGAFHADQVSLKIINFPFLLEKDEKNGGEKPRRTYSGYRYNGGISDHLPLFFLLGAVGQKGG